MLILIQSFILSGMNEQYFLKWTVSKHCKLKAYKSGNLRDHQYSTFHEIHKVILNDLSPANSTVDIKSASLTIFKNVLNKPGQDTPILLLNPALKQILSIKAKQKTSNLYVPHQTVDVF